MSRYIRIDNLEQYSLSQVINGIINVQKLKTADVVEVVRCRDCENWDDPYCRVLDDAFDEKFFCALGERRKNEI